MLTSNTKTETVWKVARREPSSGRILSLFYYAYPDYAIEYVVGSVARPLVGAMFCFMDDHAADHYMRWQQLYNLRGAGKWGEVVMLKCEYDDFTVQHYCAGVMVENKYAQSNERDIEGYWAFHGVHGDKLKSCGPFLAFDMAQDDESCFSLGIVPEHTVMCPSLRVLEVVE